MRSKQLLNIANLYPQYFDAFLQGRKNTEWRERKRIDPTLEKINPGERVVLYECGSNRAIAATVVWVRRFDSPTHATCSHLYAIRLKKIGLFAVAVRKLQGWHRRALAY